MKKMGCIYSPKKNSPKNSFEIRFNPSQHIQSLYDQITVHVIPKIMDEAQRIFLNAKVIDYPFEYKKEEHSAEIIKKIRQNTDKMTIWVSENITDRKEVLSFEKYTQRKKLRKTRQGTERIDYLIKKIAHKLNEKSMNNLIQEYLLKQKLEYEDLQVLKDFEKPQYYEEEYDEYQSIFDQHFQEIKQKLQQKMNILEQLDTKFYEHEEQTCLNPENQEK